MSVRRHILIASVAVVLLVAILGVSSTVPSASAASHSPSDVIASENVEPNDGFGNATNVTDGYYADLEITDGDADFYAVELEEGDELEASIYFSHATGDLDMRVYDGTGESIDSSTSTTDDETITLPSDTGGTYFVEVYGFQDATAPYDLEIRTSSGLADAACSLSDTEAPPGTTVFLDASDSENVDQYTYYKGDGDGDPEAEGDQAGESFTYEEAGTYQPRVAAVNFSDDSRDVADCGELVIDENESPDASLTFSPTQPAPGETITFDPSGTSDPDGDPIRFWEWDLDGDGEYEVPRESDVSVTRNFSEPGTYTVGLRVTDEHGAVGETTVTVEVQAPNEEPSATFSDQPASPVRVGEEVTFDASESSDPDGEIVEYRWDVDGDGTIDRTTDASSTTIEYTEDTQLDPAVTVIDEAGTTGNASAPVQPFVARCTVDPRNVSVGDTVTIDASGSEAGFGAQFDVDGDGEYEYERDSLSVQHAYNESGSYAPRVLVIGEAREVPVDCPSVDVTAGENQPPVARLNVTPGQPEPGETVTLDASESTDPDGEIVEYRWDIDGDGTIDRTTNTSSTTIEYTEGTRLDPAVTVIDDAGATGNASQSVDTADGGSDFPVDPETAAGLLGLLGLGGMGYYLYAGSVGGGGGGSGGSSRPPRPPKQLPEGHGLAHIETGTFSTPIESGSVSVTGLGFEPDLILLSASNVSPGEGADPATDRTDGWAHGKVRRAKDGTLLQSTMALADDSRSIDAGMGAASDGHALELLVHHDDTPERVLGSVTNTTADGFEISFDTSGLREEHADAEFAVLYKAFGFRGEPRISVGHFRTPDVPGTQTIDLGIDADHVMLFATNTVDDVDSHLMTDLPLGFSVGDVIGHGVGPAQLTRTATAGPSIDGSVGYAAFDDRALHLQYGYDGAVRGRTTAAVTALSDGRMTLEYEKVYNGPNKLGSTDSKLVSYVAMNTGDVQPAIGHFRLPEPGSDEVLVVDLGFRPSMVEFQSFAIHEMNAETVVDAPVSFGWSEGSVIADDGDVRHQMLDETTGPSVPSPGAGLRLDPGVAASVRTIADGGKITGRDDVTVTRLTDSGFEMVVTDIGTSARTGDEPRPLVFYKAWPQPIASDQG